MRILHVVQEMRMGGAERIVLSLSSGALGAGHDVAVAAAPGPLTDEVSVTFPLPLLERKMWRVPGGVRDLRRALRRWEPDVVHCHNPGMAILTSLVTRRGSSVPAVVSVHGSPARDYPRVAPLLRLSRLVSVACGPGVAQALREQNFIVDHVISNAVSPPPAPADRPTLFGEWGITEKRPLVVSVGRLVPSKGHDLVVRAVAGVPDTALAIVGEGPERDHLEREISRLQLSDRVILAGERRDARAIVAAADVAVLGSAEQEGLPLVVLEAQAAGTPVVVGDILGVRDVVEDGVSGCIVRSEEEAIANGIRGILEDPDLARTLAAGGLAAAGDYSEQDMVDRFLVLYESLVKK